jgi:hypothetical protein
MNPFLLFAGAVMMIIAGFLISKEPSMVSVGIGLMWIGLAVISG